MLCSNAVHIMTNAMFLCYTTYLTYICKHVGKKDMLISVPALKIN